METSLDVVNIRRVEEPLNSKSLVDCESVGCSEQEYINDSIIKKVRKKYGGYFFCPKCRRDIGDFIASNRR
jgi:hypothetical protein